jgi:hypothetical protein
MVVTYSCRGHSAIDPFGLRQNRPAADEIAAAFDRLALDKIDRAPEQEFRRILEVGDRRKIVARGRCE